MECAVLLCEAEIRALEAEEFAINGGLTCEADYEDETTVVGSLLAEQTRLWLSVAYLTPSILEGAAIALDRYGETLDGLDTPSAALGAIGARLQALAPGVRDGDRGAIWRALRVLADVPSEFGQPRGLINFLKRQTVVVAVGGSVLKAGA